MSTEPTQGAPGASPEASPPKPHFSLTPIRITHPENVDLSQVHFFREPAWVLRLTLADDRSYTRVKLVRAAPLTYPRQYVSVLDERDEEIFMVERLDDLEPAQRAVVEEELDRRYLTSIIEAVESVRNEFGTSYWEVRTQRGHRQFVVQNAAENARWLDDYRLLLVDVDGNRFEVPRLNRLDKRSIAFIEQVL